MAPAKPSQMYELPAQQPRKFAQYDFHDDFSIYSKDATPRGSSRPSEDSQRSLPNLLHTKDSQRSLVPKSQSPKGNDVEHARVIPSLLAAYSVFTPGQKRFAVCLAAIGCFFSAMSANIYFPALDPLAAYFHVSPAMINLTVTSYQIFQGLIPLLVGDLADSAGRRPAYLICFAVYVCANIGLALCPNFTSLMIFRCLQSSGSAPTIALGSGVIADLFDSSERGFWMSVNSAGSNVAPALGPVVGGLLAQYEGWRWIFWFLIIIALIYITVFAVFFPETGRSVVGNGSHPPPKLNVSLWAYITRARSSQQSKYPEQPLERKPLRFPNPLNGLRLLAEKDIGSILVVNALLFSLYYCTLATNPYLFVKIYKLNQLQIGLCYLPIGVGACFAAILCGKLLDWNFRRTAHKVGLLVNRGQAASMKEFPLERARLQIIMPFLFGTISLNLIYGWAVHFKAPLAAALTLQFFIGMTNTAAFSGFNTFLTDLYPQGPSTVISSNNFCRCWLGAGVTAAIIPAVEALGTGAAFTVFAGTLLLSTPVSIALVRKGPEWRTERKERLARKKEEQERKHQGKLRHLPSLAVISEAK